jgi:hypothetical protein
MQTQHTEKLYSIETKGTGVVEIAKNVWTLNVHATRAESGNPPVQHQTYIVTISSYRVRARVIFKRPKKHVATTMTAVSGRYF